MSIRDDIINDNLPVVLKQSKRLLSSVVSLTANVMNTPSLSIQPSAIEADLGSDARCSSPFHAEII